MAARREEWKKMLGRKGNQSTFAVLQREQHCYSMILGMTERPVRTGVWIEPPCEPLDRGKFCPWAPPWPGNQNEKQNWSWCTEQT